MTMRLTAPVCFEARCLLDASPALLPFLFIEFRAEGDGVDHGRPVAKTCGPEMDDLDPARLRHGHEIGHALRWNEDVGC